MSSLDIESEGPPVERVTRLALVINLKAARALGLTIWPSVLALADEIVK